MEIKGLMKSLSTNLPYLSETCPMFLLIKETTITRGLNIDISNSPPGFMIQMYITFFNIENIYGFNPTFVDICYDNSHSFGFPFSRKTDAS